MLGVHAHSGYWNKASNLVVLHLLGFSTIRLGSRIGKSLMKEDELMNFVNNCNHNLKKSQYVNTSCVVLYVHTY